ncbi:hypothetical protein [Flavilitoribacter nigricans]|uniref:Yip1 domain-containing protein n=1 Tax=Flavilitoribacter nigricans (strain ATCC 23147 / DSM 23189 / NBRC 102662 / NCIMB 1420 / SS-2) TaxID=1122177 RepID=A0A2D0N4C0_FLAN2|nr:hypothetical protein [Flavilitoribacter nigricans]PHN02989.1 hypothetical protein CRP01_29740 [Flavilitoribacter nigricans DSM 23189 = NBRC 102662]
MEYQIINSMATLHKDPVEILWDRLHELPRHRMYALLILGLLLLAGLSYYSVDLIRNERFFVFFFAGKVTGTVLAIASVLWSSVNTILLVKDSRGANLQDAFWILISAIPVIFVLFMSYVMG